MVIIGTYAHSANESLSAKESSLTKLYTLLSKILPKNVSVHLLPIYPSSGDSGFAPNNWFAFESKFGTLQDVKKLTHNWNIFTDCIYNHVGIEHELVKKLFKDPDRYRNFFYCFKTNKNLNAPKSPRGGSVLKEHFIRGNRWLIWQTFHQNSLDINLENTDVLKMITKHLSFLKKVGFSGVRLDGVSYFGKILSDSEARHSNKSKFLTRMIYDLAKSYNFEVCVQLDSDINGLKYFPQPRYNDIPIVDYSFSALVLYTIVSQDVKPLASHLQNCDSRLLIRCLRTHDGILFRSKNLDKEVIHYLINFSLKNDIPVRNIDGTPYELNSSITHLFSLGVGKEVGFQKIKLSLALSSVLYGWTYIYLPLLFNDIPEEKYSFEDDPRLLNRKPIQARNLNSNHRDIFRFLSELSLANKFARKKPEIRHFGSVIEILHPKSKLIFIGNFSKNNDAIVQLPKTYQILSNQNCNGNTLTPQGFYIIKAT